jgi:CRISPR system Cascade subunit CasB
MSASKQLKSHVCRQIKRLDAGTPWATAMLAKLRRGAGKPPGELSDIFEVTIGGLDEDSAGGASYAEWAAHTALTLYALHRQSKHESVHAQDGDTFGRAIGCIAGFGTEKNDGVHRRFSALLSASSLAEVSNHARGLVQLLRAADYTIKFDYAQFANDLYTFQFDNSRSDVRLRWGRDFYSHSAQNDDDDTKNTNNEGDQE